MTMSSSGTKIRRQRAGLGAIGATCVGRAPNAQLMRKLLLPQHFPRPRRFRPCVVGADAAGRVGEGGTGGLSA